MLHKDFRCFVTLTRFQAASCWLEWCRWLLIRAELTSARVQALLIRRWKESGSLTFCITDRCTLLKTLRREKQLVAQELIGLMLDDLYEREA